MDMTSESPCEPTLEFASLFVPECPTAPLHPDAIRPGWDIDPARRAAIVQWLALTSRPGARDKDGPISTRHALRAMRTLGSFSRLALDRQKLDHKLQVSEAGTYALKDHVTPVIDVAGPRMTEEAHRRGLDCAAALDEETKDAIYLTAEAELKAAGVDTDPGGVERPKPARRSTWIIPQIYMVHVVARLIDMVDPAGREAQVLGLRERLMAAQLLGQLDRLALAQEAFALEVHAAGPVFDRERALAEIREEIPRRLEERRREREEGLRRVAEAAAAARGEGVLT